MSGFLADCQSPIILVEFGQGMTLSGHVDKYDAIATRDNGSKTGLYQNRYDPNTYSNPVRGMSIHRDYWEF